LKRLEKKINLTSAFGKKSFTSDQRNAKRDVAHTSLESSFNFSLYSLLPMTSISSFRKHSEQC